ncbi:MAG: hypothetical protein Q7S92_05550 [Candidatus Diapherotrites archaeon]|nr:hypothetical protein [Candidatus Diapherotrites archaeon]
MTKTKLLGKCILNKRQLAAQAENVKKELIGGVEVLFEISHPTKEKILHALKTDYLNYLDGLFPVLSAEIGWTLNNETILDVLSQNSKIRKQSRESIQTAIELLEKIGFEHLNIHLTGDMRKIESNNFVSYERNKMELLSEFREFLNEIGKKKIVLENIPLLEIPNPPGTFTTFHEIGKLPQDFIQLKTNTTLDIAHAGLTLRTLLDQEKQKTFNSHQARVNSYLGWKPVYFGLEEQTMETKLLKQKETKKEKTTQEVIRWLKLIQRKGKLKQVHLNNCSYENRLFKGKSMDGHIEGDLELSKIIQGIRKVKPKFIVTEIKEEKEDYVNLKNNKTVWEMIKKNKKGK